MNPSLVAKCVRQYVDQGIALLAPDEWAQWIRAPAESWAQHADAFRAALHRAGVPVTELSDYVRNSPYLLLPNVFDCAHLPQTPEDWLPIPDVPATRAALAAAVLLAGVCSMEAVSYGSENGGALFVNMVTLVGKGALAEKSQGNMRGHTDAATFPFRGTRDPDYPRIAPSPDIVFLAALRNEDKVPTAVMPLADILDRLSGADLDVLKGPNMVLSAQRTFVKGTQKILGDTHVLDGAAVLHDGPEGTWVRYTHSQSLIANEDDQASASAKAKFEAACLAVTQQIVLKPGDLLLVNNRKALHGRSKVGPAVGGESRWLIRGYGLDCGDVAEDQRYQDTAFKLFP